MFIHSKWDIYNIELSAGDAILFEHVLKMQIPVDVYYGI